ncbi:hypothetical protein F4779DRAFT_559910 [Xylariaceae sp. FL0662B]|nr:hypothetical protein F4779DRAFT_559910 [Xylariaceae sp. FL0662B]
MASKHAWKIELFPWDHSSPEHVERMYDQRVACGWRADEVPSWIESAKKGGRIFYWIVFSDALPDREKIIRKHVAAYPKEASSLRDTAAEIRLAQRQPTMREFLPIGHVALDIHKPEEDAKFGLPFPGTVWMHQLYISYVLQGGGFGAGTMSKIETLAAQEPMKATTMALDTLSKETQNDAEREKVMNMENLPPPVISKEEWYANQGYEAFKWQDDGYTWTPKEGINLALRIVYMKKTLG